jgi:predicted nucleic acid-binding protein
LGRLETDLARHNNVGIDTAPFIYLWESNPRYHHLSKALFEFLKQPHIMGVTSIITLIEVCVYPQNKGRADLVQAYERALLNSQQIQLLPVDINIARQAIILRSKYKIHVPDALQIATAIVAGSTAFATNDRRLAQVKEIQILLFDNYIE